VEENLVHKVIKPMSSHHIAKQSFGSIPITNMNKIFKLRPKKLSKDRGDGWKDLKQLEKNNVLCP
jgi:hypothetical protein